MPEPKFRDLYDSAYNSFAAQKAARTAATTILAESAKLGAALGHPNFESLTIGQTAESKALVFFLDIRGFTKLSFIYTNEELLRILQALTAASVISITQFGGHVIEFTGDGVMAVFGDTSTNSEEACFAGMHCASYLMKGVRDEVNPLLKAAGTEPIRVAIGMEFGEVLWSRIGITGTSQVKPISEVTFLAGKLSSSKYTNAWEAKAGEDLAAWIPDDFKLRAKRYEFSVNEKSYTRELYLFKWKEFGDEYQSDAPRLRSRLLAKKLGPSVLTSSRVVQPNPSARTSARPLKDQPFF
jgi:class 3 adenylate cyclase